MDRKILAVMVTLVVVAALVVAFVMIAAGGIRGHAGGLTDLFDDLQDPAQDQHLVMPSNWAANQVKTVSDVIIDLTYYEQTVAQTKVYVTTLYFAYMGEKWSDAAEEGSHFWVPDNSGDGWMPVDHGLFHITVSSATNISEDYHPGDVIELKVSLVNNDANQQLAFGVWTVADTI